MASDVEIANNALALLGDDSITALSDNTVRAKLANRLFNQTRDAALRAHPWNCATTRQQLSLLAAAPIFGWDYQFTLPTDPYCLRVLAVNDDESLGIEGNAFRVETRVLLTNDSTAKIRFIKRITDPNEYDVLLYEAFSARLAAKMAYPITKSLTVSQTMWELYERILREARSVDGQEGTPEYNRPESTCKEP